MPTPKNAKYKKLQQMTGTLKVLVPHHGGPNREQRRLAIYGNPVKRLVPRIKALRGTLLATPVKGHPSQKKEGPPKIKFFSRKFLSGLYSRLLAMAA